MEQTPMRIQKLVMKDIDESLKIMSENKQTWLGAEDVLKIIQIVIKKKHSMRNNEKPGSKMIGRSIIVYVKQKKNHNLNQSLGKSGKYHKIHIYKIRKKRKTI